MRPTTGLMESSGKRDRMRLFAAIFPDVETLTRVVSFQRKLRDALNGAASWVQPERMHITLKFFGDADLQTTRSAVACAFGGVSAFQVKLSGADAFPSLGRARVLVLNADVMSQVPLLDDGAQARPHLTVGRFRKPVRIAALPQFESQVFLVKKVVLINSVMARRENAYEVIGQWDLDS
jgi:2'-5' RNA ligase